MSTCRKPLRASKCIDFATNRDTWELPRTAEAYDAMVEQMAEQLKRADWVKCCLPTYYTELAKVALRAIGITRPKKTKL